MDADTRLGWDARSSAPSTDESGPIPEAHIETQPRSPDEESIDDPGGANALQAIIDHIEYHAPVCSESVCSESASSCMSTQPVALRHITAEELYARNLLRRHGPPPQKGLILMANELARNKLCGVVESVRHVAARHPGYEGGGCRTRALRYAELIIAVLQTETGREMQGSLPPSPPSPGFVLKAPLPRHEWRWRVRTVGVVMLLLCVSYFGAVALNLRWLEGASTSMRADADTSFDGALQRVSVEHHPGSPPGRDGGDEGPEEASGNGTQCPATWTQFDEDDGTHRCFYMTRQFATHYDCATQLCPSAAHGESGLRGTATLATISSPAVNRFLFERLASGSKAVATDLWIGLYHSPLAANLSSEWLWANEREAAMPKFTSWQRGQPDALYGREDCAFLSGTTGQWEDFACHLPELRCLCELGDPPTPSYHEAATQHADLMRADAARQRMWATLVIGGIAALPIALPLSGSVETALSSLTASQRREAALHASSPPSFHGQPTPSPRLSLARRALVHLGIIMLIGGFAPFIAHHLYGCWNALHLRGVAAAYTIYLPFAPLGFCILKEALPGVYQRWLAIVSPTMCLAMALTAARNTYRLYSWEEPHGTLMMCTFLGLACANTIFPGRVLYHALRPSTSHYQLYAMMDTAHYYIAGTAGALILLGFGPIAMLDPDMARYHPYSLGIWTTALTWIATALLCTRQNCERFFGDLSNERRLKLALPVNGPTQS